MSVSPKDFLSSAREWLESQTEMAARNSVSRAYYAAFHQSQLAFPPSDEVEKQRETGMHRSYIDQLLKAQTNSAQRWVGVKLGAMKSRRVLADYRIDSDFPGAKVAMQMDDADKVIRCLESEMASAAKTTVQVTITAEEQPPATRTLQRIK